MRAIFTKAIGDLRHHTLQTIVIITIVALAAGVGTLALTLINSSSTTYDAAFARYRGAHLTVTFHGTRADADQISATAQLPDVTNSAGPWPESIVGVEYGSAKAHLLMIGRTDANAPLDRLQIVAGRWVEQPGEVVLTRSFAQQANLVPGDRLLTLNRPDTPHLTVVGEVVDIDEGTAGLFDPQDAWVTPDQVVALLPASATPGFMMLYRFQHAATQSELDKDSQEIASALPTGAIDFSIDHLELRQIFDLSSSLVLSFLLAFAVFALGAVVLIVANLVAGAVLASYRDIGIIRSLGFTPRQTVFSFVLQMLIPSAIGCLIGAPLGALGSIPILTASAASLGLPGSTPSLLAPALLAVIGILLIVSITAALPALRAGRLSPSVAITQSTALSSQRRSRLGEMLQRIGASRSFSLGASDAFARPVRGILTTVAILVGVATLTFAFGLHASFQRMATDPGLLGGPDVAVQRFGSYPDATLMSTLAAQTETTRIIASSFTSARIPEVGNPIATFPMRGDSASIGYHLFAGRWFTGPGEIVAASTLAHDAHLNIGDTITVTINGHTLSLRLVGIYFTFNNFGRELRIDWSDYVLANPNAQPDFYTVNVRPGTDIQTYTQRIYASAPNFLSVQEHPAIGQSILQTLDVVLVVMALILTAIAVAGVLNTVLLTTHERAHDIATLKTLGMSPGQVIGMVCATAGVLGIIGGIIGIPAGIWLHQELLGFSGSAVSDPLPESAYAGAFTPFILPLFAIAGIGVALLGASLPARWAARQSVVEVLRTE